jgi:hypothetical protein
VLLHEVVTPTLVLMGKRKKLKRLKPLIVDPGSQLERFPKHYYGAAQALVGIVKVRLGLMKEPEWVEGYDPEDPSVLLKYDKANGVWVEWHEPYWRNGWFYMDRRRNPVIGDRDEWLGRFKAQNPDLF